MRISAILRACRPGQEVALRSETTWGESYSGTQSTTEKAGPVTSSTTRRNPMELAGAEPVERCRYHQLANEVGRHGFDKAAPCDVGVLPKVGHLGLRVDATDCTRQHGGNLSDLCRRRG